MKIKDEQEILELLRSIGQPMGISVPEIEFKQGKSPALTVYIDKQGGIDLDLCAKFHHAIDIPLDELDPTYGLPYTLNVSSLGADRPFKTDEDFNSHIGKKVEVRLKSSMQGKKFYDGVLQSYNGEAITLKVDAKRTFTIYLKNVVKVNEYIDFE